MVNSEIEKLHLTHKAPVGSFFILVTFEMRGQEFLRIIRIESTMYSSCNS